MRELLIGSQVYAIALFVPESILPAPANGTVPHLCGGAHDKVLQVRHAAPVLCAWGACTPLQAFKPGVLRMVTRGLTGHRACSRQPYSPADTSHVLAHPCSGTLSATSRASSLWIR